MDEVKLTEADFEDIETVASARRTELSKNPATDFLAEKTGLSEHRVRDILDLLRRNEAAVAGKSREIDSVHGNEIRLKDGEEPAGTLEPLTVNEERIMRIRMGINKSPGLSKVDPDRIKSIEERAQRMLEERLKSNPGLAQFIKAQND